MKKSKFVFVLILIVCMCMPAIAQKGKNSLVKQMTTNQFKAQIWNYSSDKEWKYLGNKPAIIDLYADWCPPCRKLAPILAEIAQEYAGKIDVFKINVDNEPELAQLFNASSIPLMVFIPKDEKPTLIKGARPNQQIEKIINSVLFNTKK